MRGRGAGATSAEMAGRVGSNPARRALTVLRSRPRFRCRARSVVGRGRCAQSRVGQRAATASRRATGRSACAWHSSKAWSHTVLHHVHGSRGGSRFSMAGASRARPQSSVVARANPRSWDFRKVLQLIIINLFTPQRSAVLPSRRPKYRTVRETPHRPTDFFGLDPRIS